MSGRPVSSTLQTQIKSTNAQYINVTFNSQDGFCMNDPAYPTLYNVTDSLIYFIPEGIRKCQEIRVIEANIPNSRYNVSSTDRTMTTTDIKIGGRDTFRTTNYFEFLEYADNVPNDPLPLTFTLPPGVYTLEEFRLLIESALNYYSPHAPKPINNFFIAGGDFSVELVPELIPEYGGGFVTQTFRMRITNLVRMFQVLTHSRELGFSPAYVPVDVNTVLSPNVLQTDLYTYLFLNQFIRLTCDTTNYMNVREVVAMVEYNYAITLDEGIYNATELATEIQGKLNAATVASGTGTIFTVSYSDTTMKYHFNSTNPATYYIVKRAPDYYNSCYDILGFNGGPFPDITDPSGVDVYSDNIALINRNNNFIIASTMIHGYINVHTDVGAIFRNTNEYALIRDDPLWPEYLREIVLLRPSLTQNIGILATIQNIKNPREIVFYKNLMTTETDWVPLSNVLDNEGRISEFASFMLLDGLGNQINLNGTHWSFTVQMKIY